jgi:hypothetical protein
MSTNTLTTTLPAQINQEHQACIRAAGQALEHALRCGDLLMEAKADCRHGEWQSWLAEHFEGSKRSAQAYMRLADNRELLESKSAESALLSIDGAMKLIAGPKVPDGQKQDESPKQGRHPYFPPIPDCPPWPPKDADRETMIASHKARIKWIWFDGWACKESCREKQMAQHRKLRSDLQQSLQDCGVGKEESCDFALLMCGQQDLLAPHEERIVSDNFKMLIAELEVPA